MRRAICLVLVVSAIGVGCEQIGDLDDLVLDPCYRGDCSDALVDGTTDTFRDTSLSDSNTDITVVDAPLDAFADRSDDGMTDASNDAELDSETDASPDVAQDASVDAPFDARDAASDAAADASTCPTGKPGPPMIRVGGSACMDGTEITYAQYQTFLAAKGSNVSGQPVACSWNTSYTPLFYERCIATGTERRLV